MIEAFKALCGAKRENRPRLLLAPRHPERFAEVASLLESSGLSWTRRSDAPQAKDAACDAILLDTVGELRAVYPLAELSSSVAASPPSAGITCWSRRPPRNAS